MHSNDKQLRFQLPVRPAFRKTKKKKNSNCKNSIQNIAT